MNKILRGLIGILIGCLIWSVTVFADSSVAILETYTGDSQISVYVKGTEADMNGVSIQIATAEADQFNAKPISELDKPMKTLVMVDNSISISADNREKIAEFLQNLISDRLNNEEICIATFSEDINIVTDYSSDYATLKQAIGSISYQDQETYLTDVLYDLISAQYTYSAEDIYCRIIVVSDGVDNKSLGYTKDELYSLLKDIQVPIYTIGSVNKNNNDELENMFALSRMSFAEYFLLDDTENVMAITETLKEDRDIVRLTITPPEEMMDGSKKAVKITFTDASVLTAEITMPQQVQEKGSQKEPAEEEGAEPETVVEITSEERPDANTDFPIIVFIVMAAIIVVTITCAVLIMLKKKKSNQVKFEALDDNILRELEENTSDSGDNTEMIGSFYNSSDEGSTVMIWNQNTTYQVVLTDVNLPAKSFRVPLNNSIIIGRPKKSCVVNLDIALGYDGSVSGPHCEITVKDGKFYIKDLQSSNGTYVNDSKISAETEIFPGNILKFGRLEMRFEVR